MKIKLEIRAEIVIRAKRDRHPKKTPLSSCKRALWGRSM